MGGQPDDIHHNHRLELTYRPIESIKPHPRDPRVYGAAEKRRIARSIRAFGPMPMIVTSAQVLISGNIWLEAAKLAGVTEAPVVLADHLTPAQADAFMLAQVRLVERGEWDQQMLGEILRDLTLQDLDFDLEITGFDVPEIDLCIEGLDQKAQQTDPADEPAPLGPPVSRPGDLWVLGEHRIFCASALEAEAYRTLMGDERAAVVFADPPYNVRIGGNVSGLGAVKHGEFAMASGEMSEAEFTGFLTNAMSHAAAYSAEGSLGYWCMDWAPPRRDDQGRTRSLFQSAESVHLDQVQRGDGLAISQPARAGFRVQERRRTPPQQCPARPLWP